MKLVKRISTAGGAHWGWRVWCPGCKVNHVFDNRWTFDGNEEAPTFSPSLLVRSGHLATGHVPGDSCWCTYSAEHPEDPSGFACGVCHSFLRAGVWEFLNDSTHTLKGQRVPVAPAPENGGEA